MAEFALSPGQSNTRVFELVSTSLLNRRPIPTSPSSAARARLENRSWRESADWQAVSTRARGVPREAAVWLRDWPELSVSGTCGLRP